LSFNARAEHLEINSSVKTGWHSSYNPPAMDEFTFTTQYAIWANVLSRVEFRWDHLEHGKTSRAFGNTNIGFDNSDYSLSGTSIHNNAYLLALNLIYQF